jgi:hypothetical protein
MMKLIYLALALTIAAPAAAQVCNTPNGWNTPTAHGAARKMPLAFALTVGPATRLALLPASEVTPAISSDRKTKPDTMSGLAALDVPRAGKLDIALSTAAYVDLIRDGKALPSVGHRHADACTGIRKIVTFDVQPGRYIVELTDAPDKSVVMQATLN